MARWQDAPHATVYRLILGRIAGIEESRLVELANGTGVEEIIAAAKKKRTEKSAMTRVDDSDDSNAPDAVCLGAIVLRL